MTTTFYEVPLSGAPQSFSISIAGATYNLRLTYQNVADGGWVLDLSDSSGNAIVQGIPLVTGADLLAQYGYLGLGFSLVVNTDGDADAVPTFANLGTLSHLYVAVSS